MSSVFENVILLKQIKKFELKMNNGLSQNFVKIQTSVKLKLPTLSVIYL